MLEEPKAAFHDWLFRHRADLNNALGPARLVLVCDVGGGTTDLTLIQVAHENGQPQLTRIGVGDHLMLGGDNMDLALAHLVERGAGRQPHCAAPVERAPVATGGSAAASPRSSCWPRTHPSRSRSRCWAAARG